jgi:hypothetical protein
MASNTIKIVSPVCEARFPNLTSTEKFDGTDTGKYSLTIILDEKDIKPIEKAIAEANGGKGNNPLKQIPADAEYDAGKYKLKAKSQFQVKAVNRNKESIDLSRVGGGASIRVQLGFAPYTQGGGGVTVYLGNVQVLKEGQSNDLDFGDLPEGFGDSDDLGEDLPF